MNSEKTITKRDGTLESYDEAVMRAHLTDLASDLPTEHIDLELVLGKIKDGIYDRISHAELSNLAAETCAYLNIIHPDYSRLASKISVYELHKVTPTTMLECTRQLFNYVDTAGRKAGIVNERLVKVVEENADRIQAAIDYSRDYNYDFFGFKTLERSYLIKFDKKTVERPQHMLMRVSLGIHYEDVESAIETYHLMSQMMFTHATPTLFNSGTIMPQLSSCFLLTMKGDSIEGIYDTLKQCALISKSAGGIGLSVHGIRAKDSYIRGTNGVSNGIIPMLRVYNATARYVDQGGGKRKGSFAIYLEPWHADIFDFLVLKKNTGKEEQRARDLFFAMWINDLFMQRVKEDKEWTLMCPNECPGLDECWGEKFEELYTGYEKAGKGRKTIKAQQLWAAIIEAQIETGTPYMLYKDACNRKSNQQNLGTIKSSNLCTEIIEYTAPDEVAVCNLASICLPKYVKEDRTFDFVKLEEVTAVITKNLNKVIDVNYYPVPEAKNSNMRHRPIGIGVQGLADAFMSMRYPYESDEASKLNEDIFETIYYSALKTSVELAKVDGSYTTFPGSPMSKGVFQFEMWGVKPTDRYDWEALRKDMMTFGARNSLLIAPMPTASTAQIMGNTESFEPLTSNLYLRRVLSGEFVMLNRLLVDDLIELGLWNKSIKTQLMANNGSIQEIAEIPDRVKQLYKTVWEISQKRVIEMAAGRGKFIDQSQSLNIHIQDPSYGKLSSMHFYAWSQGLKTGMYYLRSKPATDAIKFTLDVEELKKSKSTELPNVEQVCVLGKKLEDGEICYSCSG